MGRIKMSKILIMVSIFLVVSLAGNLLFAMNLKSQHQHLGSLQLQLSKNSSQFSSQEQRANEQLQQLRAAHDRQLAFAKKVSEMGQEIARLQQYQAETDKTVELTNRKLEQIRETFLANSAALDTNIQKLNKNSTELEITKKRLRANAAELKQTIKQLQRSTVELENTREKLVVNSNELQDARQKLEEAQGVINNQFRALKKLAQQKAELSSGAKAILQQLTQTFTREDPVRIVELTNAVQVNIPFTALFTSKKPMLDITALRWLAPIAEVLAAHPEVDIQIIGHTDSRTRVDELSNIYASNWELSSARAGRVAAELINLGVPAKHLLASGKSSVNPVREIFDESSWLYNHRIEILVK